MEQIHRINHSVKTTGRVLLFCLGTAIILATASRLSQESPEQWAPHIIAIISIPFTLGLTIFFVFWEGLKLREAGIVPDQNSLMNLSIGFLIGITMAGGHALLVLISGHVYLIYTTSLDFTAIVSNFVLYSLLAYREELSFRAYPLRSLNYVSGAVAAQSIVAFIFAVEHKIGGYSWTQAFFGAGIGALLFGYAALISKGIALPTGIHAAWNFGHWCLGFNHEPGLWQAVVDKGFEKHYETFSLVCYWLIIGTTTYLLYIYYQRRQPIAAAEKTG